jgi:hypothetical protein
VVKHGYRAKQSIAYLPDKAPEAAGEKGDRTNGTNTTNTIASMIKFTERLTDFSDSGENDDFGRKINSIQYLLKLLMA